MLHSDLAVAPPVEAQVRAYVADKLPEVGKLVEFNLPSGPGQQSVVGGEHAAALAEQFAYHLREVKAVRLHTSLPPAQTVCCSSSWDSTTKMSRHRSSTNTITKPTRRTNRLSRSTRLSYSLAPARRVALALQPNPETKIASTPRPRQLGFLSMKEHLATMCF